jgi:hypothetical protein
MTAAEPAIELDGRRFTVPSLLVAVGRDERLALGVFTGAPTMFGADFLEYEIAPGAVDFSLVRTGRCPLLAEHCFALEALLGAVADARIEGTSAIQIVVCFARGRDSDRLWDMLCDGFPLSLSIGARILDAVKVETLPDGRAHYRATRWRLTEVSLCVLGKDEGAYLRRLAEPERAQVLADWSATTEDGTAARQAIERRLHLDRWRSWSTRTTAQLAEELGIDRDRLGDALDREVAAQCAQLAADLS